MMHITHGSSARQSRARLSRGVLALAGAIIVAGCRDVPVPADPIARAMPATASQRAHVYEPNFDRYSAKVTITMTGGGIAKLPPMAERRVEYSIERVLSGGEWTTTFDFQSVRDAGQLRRIPIRKVVAGSDGMKYFDHNGSLIPLGSRLPEVANAADFPAFPDARRAAPAADTADPRAWAENLITTREQGARRRAEVARSFELAGARGRTVRYRKQRGDIATEIVFDTTRGTIEETRTTRGGRVAASTRYEYQAVGAERWLRVRSLHRQEDPGADRHPMTVEQLLADQRFHRTEGR